MQHYKVNILKKKFGINALLTLLFTSLLLSANPIRIMPLGDSITRGDSATHNTGYRGPLWSKLVNAGYNVDFVGGADSNVPLYDVNFDADHEGHNGFTADQIDSNVTNYLTANPTDIILLHVGTNDLTASGDNSDLTVNDVTNILTDIDNYSTDIKVILARIIDQNSHSAETTSFNNKLEIMAQQRIANGDDIHIVDMENGADINYTTDMYDLLHPNDTGYDKMADQWYSALKSVIPMHHWKLDELSGTSYLDSYRDANGTCTGVNDCPTAIKGKINGAQEFDGTDKINVTDTTTFNWDANASFTIAFWMKTNTNDTNGKRNIMMGQQNNSNGTGLAWFIGVQSSTEVGSGKIIFGLNDSNDTGSTDSYGDNIIVSDNVWHHIACVRDGDNHTTKIYIDGILDSTKIHTYDAPFNDGTLPITFGSLNVGGFNYTGSLDEISVFDSALSEVQLQQHYQNVHLMITTTPPTLAEYNVPYFYDVNSSNDPFASFVLNTSPDWMQIDPDFGIISGTPDTVDNFDVQIEAFDVNGTTIQNYVLKVRNTALLPSGMNHYWRLDELYGPLYLDSYAGADGTCSEPNCPNLNTTGIGESVVGNAQVFDGTQKVDVTNTSTFNWAANTSFTIEFWMKTDTNDTNGKRNIMMGQQNNSNGTGLTWFIGVLKSTEVASGKIIFGLNDSNDTGSTDSYGDNIIVSDNVWHHIACVRDGDNNTTKIYIDGTLDDTKIHTYDAPFNNSNLPVTFGYLKVGGFNYTGSLDEIAIFDYALNQTEIQTHFSQGQSQVGFDNQDVTPPVITLIGSDVSIELGTPYSDAGATASDNIDGDITANIVTVNSVNVNNIGSYTVTYNVNDSAGNTASQVTRTVTVTADITPPVITLIGSDVTIELATPYNDAGATASDNIDGNITSDIITVNPVNVNVEGNYTVTYDVNDSAGNQATQVTRTVTVTANVTPTADVTPPQITLIGNTPIYILKGSIYVDAGATAMDNVDGDITENIVTVNPVDTNTVGQYIVSYNVSDTEGNTATEVTRTVNVVNDITPIITFLLL